MGAFYGSIQVKTEDRETVLAAAARVARERDIKCLVGPAIKGWVGIYPESNGQDDQVGVSMARELSGWVLHVMVHDSDVMAYWLWRDHELLDSYWSKPGYFGEEGRTEQEAMKGRPEVFGELIGKKVAKLGNLLDREAEGSVFEEERLEQFAKLLGVANALTAYEYLKGGENQDVTGWRKFKEVPEEGKEPSTGRSGRWSRIKKEIAQLKRDRLLLLRDERQMEFSHGCAVELGFAVQWMKIPSIDSSVYIYESPWQAPRRHQIELPPRSNGFTSDASGQRLGMALVDRLQIYTAAKGTWNVIADIPETPWASNLAMSPDGSMIGYGSNEGLVVTRIATKETILKMPGRNPQSMAFHPSNEWIMAAGETLGLISVFREPHWSDLYIGGKQPLPDSLSLIDRLQSGRLSREEWDRQLEERVLLIVNRTIQMAKGAKIKFPKEDVDLTLDHYRQVTQLEKEKIIAILEGRAPYPVAALMERICSVGVSRDGRWMWCGTEKGLRVFKWESVPHKSGAEMPAPVWRFTLPATMESGIPQNVFATAEEVGGAAIIFASGHGRLFRLDLANGEVRELPKLPGDAFVSQLVMSTDGNTLGIGAQWAPELPMDIRQMRPVWDVWDYPKMRERAMRGTLVGGS